MPGYAQLSVSGQTEVVHASSTSDVRALQKAASSTDRIAAIWFSSTSFELDLNLGDGQTHQVAFYCLDWGGSDRAQTMEILDASNNALLDSRSVSQFHDGKYMVWNLSVV